MTTYVILQQIHDANPMTGEEFIQSLDNDLCWKQVAQVEARSDVSAIRNHDSEYDGDSGVYVAVPARSWRPRTVRAEQTTKLTIT